MSEPSTPGQRHVLRDRQRRCAPANWTPTPAGSAPRETRYALTTTSARDRAAPRSQRSAIRRRVSPASGERPSTTARDRAERRVALRRRPPAPSRRRDAIDGLAETSRSADRRAPRRRARRSDAETHQDGKDSDRPTTTAKALDDVRGGRRAPGGVVERAAIGLDRRACDF